MKLLLSESEIKKRVKELADTISKDYKNKSPIFIGILNGCYVFIFITSDLDKINFSAYA